MNGDTSESVLHIASISPLDNCTVVIGDERAAREAYARNRALYRIRFVTTDQDAQIQSRLRHLLLKFLFVHSSRAYG